MQISTATPRNFNFKRTVISHGWRELLPFEFDQTRWVLKRVLDFEGSAPLTVTIRATGRELRIDASRRLSKRATERIARDVRHMLRLDDDMTSFYREMKQAPDFEWIVRQGAGRMLRSPTVFEDLVKMICTTNCSWTLTDKMVTGLVQNLGRESNDARRTFPTPEAMALMPVKFYVNEVRAGYRAAYLKELADRVASGSLKVEEWLESPLPTAELIKQVKSVKGWVIMPPRICSNSSVATMVLHWIPGRGQNFFKSGIMVARQQTKRLPATTHASKNGAVWHCGVI